MRHERITISLDLEESQKETAFELFEHLQEWLDITKRNGMIKSFNLSLGLPTFSHAPPESCPVCRKVIGHAKAVSDHRRIERH